MAIKNKLLQSPKSRRGKILICIFAGIVVIVLLRNTYSLYYGDYVEASSDRLSEIPEIPAELRDILKALDTQSEINYLIKRSGISSLRIELEFQLSANNFTAFFSNGLEYNDLLNDSRFYITTRNSRLFKLIAIVERFEKSDDIPFKDTWKGRTRTELPANIRGEDLYGLKTITAENDKNHFVIAAVYDIQSEMALFHIYSTRRF